MEDDLRDFVHAETAWEQAPAAVDPEAVEDLARPGGYAETWNALLRAVGDALSLGIGSSARILARITGFLLLGAVFRAWDEGAGGEGVRTAFRLLYFLALTMQISEGLEGTLSLATETLNASCRYLVATMPVSAVLLVMNGEAGRATLQSVSLTHAVGLVSVITARILLPLTRAALAMSLAGAVGDGALNALVSFITRTVKRCVVLLFTLLTAVLTLQHALAAAADSVAMRGVRFAAGSFIPVVGSLVGEAGKTLSAGIDLVRKECGAVCLLILGYLFLRPVIRIALEKTALSLLSASSGVLRDKEAAGFFKGIGEIWDLILAITVFQACYFMFSTMLFLGGGVS
ncbi:MAG: hypothetical protein II776_07220 [Clostridia bacterium]|nr:hypothetical protein [Clostridia bacterium]